jgi:hypothetical protein
MLSKRVGLLVVLSLLILGVFFYPEIEDALIMPKTNDSFRELFLSPKLFEMKKVTLEGYEYCSFENHVLWVSKLARTRNSDFSKVIWLDISPNDKLWPKFVQYSGKIVTITGIFSREIIGHGGFCHGGLTNITEVELIPRKRH